MSALPTAFTIPPSTRNKPPAWRRNERAARRAAHHSGPRRGLRASPTGLEYLGTNFASIYDAYHRRVYSQCFRMLHNQDAAEDAAQEVFLQVFRKAHTFRGESSFSTWLYRLTTNCVLMEIRRNRHRVLNAIPRDGLLGAGEGNAVLDPPLDSFEAPPAGTFDRLILGAAISQLPLGYQAIFKLHDIEGYTHQEVASRLGIQAGTSKSQLHKARIRMRLLLQNGGGGAPNQQPRLRDHPLDGRDQPPLRRPFAAALQGSGYFTAPRTSAEL